MTPAPKGLVTTYATILCALVWVFPFGQTYAQSTQSGELHTKVIEQIIQCVSHAKEAVLFPRGVQCAEYQKGARSLKPEALLELNLANVCQDQEDWRTLPGSAIKTIVGRQPPVVDTMGIRLMGAVFCDPLDLIGLELTYSLVLDKSIFAQGILARSFRTHGDLSLDGSLVLGALWLARSHIGGTVFASKSLISKLEVLDSEVQGSLLFRDSLFLEPAVFDTVSLSGELAMRGSAFPYILVQFSKIAGVLDLTQSQARCAYHIRKSEIGDLVAVDLGFGSSEKASADSGRPGALFDWRSDAKFAGLLGAARKAPECGSLGRQPGCPSEVTRKAAESKYCEYSAIASSPGTFLISDTRMKSSLCLRLFRWLESKTGADENSFVTLKDINVGTSASVNLAPADAHSGTRSYPTHNLQILGLEANAFLFNFDKFNMNILPYKLSLSGLKFQHVYVAEGLACDYNPAFADPDPEKPSSALVSSLPQLESVSNPGAHLRVPLVDEVMSWLQGNSLLTTQPFAAFVEVFQKHGDDKDAKELRIAKASAELCLKAQRVFGSYIDRICANRTTEPSAPQAGDRSSRFSGVIEFGNDLAAILFGVLLWLVADHGYRPEKVGWFVLGTICVFWLYFWLKLKIVGFAPKEKDTVLPVGLVFLFDRLLPAYHIREDHYQIGSFYKLAGGRASTEPKPASGRKAMRYLRKDMAVVEANDREKEHAHKCLDVLKVIGLVLAIFLVAAINALVSR
jgi:hypothetical protein